MNKKQTGELGEQIAEAIYKKWGHKVLHRNMATPFGEIDIITRSQGITHLIEVKVAGKSSFGSAYEKWHSSQDRKSVV